MIKVILKKLSEFFSDGQFLSSMRLVYICWSIGALVVWFGLNVYGCLVLHSVVMVGIHPMVTTFLATLTGGKIIQNYTENQATVEQAGSINPILK